MLTRTLRGARGAACTLAACALGGASRASLPVAQTRSGTQSAAQTALSLAVDKGDTAAVAKAMMSGAALNAYDDNGLTALILAARAGRWLMVGYLLNRGADPSLPDRYSGMTPLMYACQRGDIRDVRRLLAAGASVNMLSGTGASALCEMPWRGSSQIPLLLLAHGADPNARHNGRIPLLTPLAMVAGTARHAALAAMLQAGADVNGRSLWPPYSALSAAASAGDLYAVRMLLHHGADPTAVGPKGFTPVRAAFYSHSRAVIACILRAAKPWRAAHKGMPGRSVTPPKEVKFGIP